ncbi:Uncharacterised protein [[Clostridium] sordellii]|uniref:hypothetical protein n=1 Tax=Paraclostridium sordellii TaxID=1505 RepID=UPI0005E49879|nr:hypothetical protein [Paeniclostridium sordellii]MDU1454580.1 hypothetical protein [Paeniclostridium sordellii]CEO10852.1 Uncharacterised protein [[Clostridium] sordellii] [Paeniclostridium sordellii]CEQ18553.1 Uncharacterised protein [[Clostridium] sordellii] [Paeniclostridium sordellii]
MIRSNIMKKFIIPDIALTVDIIIYRDNVQLDKRLKMVLIRIYHHFEVDKNDFNDMIVKKHNLKTNEILKNNRYTSISIKELKNCRRKIKHS